MNATITYRVDFVPHPFDPRQADKGVRAWCLLRVTQPEAGPRMTAAVAIFNLDSEAEAFMGHVWASGLDGSLVSIASDTRELFEYRAKIQAQLAKNGRKSQ